MACPFVHLCEKSLCTKELICTDASFWSDYWKAKTKKEEAEKGITKAERRKERKAEMKMKGRKTVKRDEKQVARREIFSNTPLCVRKGDWCDKWEACFAMNECIVTIPRIQANPALIEFLRGPRTIKEIIRLLSQHDCEPMKSYYRIK